MKIQRILYVEVDRKVKSQVIKHDNVIILYPSISDMQGRSNDFSLGWARF
jgi:hypothetical protein